MDAYEKSGGYVPISKSQDRVFWSRLAKQGLFYNIISPLGHYRLLQDSLSHYYNPYNKMLYEFRRKMILDDTILESDVKWYNDLYRYSKPYTQKSEGKILKRRKTMEEWLYSLLRPIIGQSISEKMIVLFKNAYYRWKLNV